MVYITTNQFWIAANIIFELGTGQTKEVLMLVNNVLEATVFPSEQEAANFYNFVRSRASTVQWFLDPPTPQRPQGWVIRGIQEMQRAR